VKERKVWFHKSREDKRYWLHWGRACWYLELVTGIKQRHCHADIEIGGDENDIKISVGIPFLFAFWFGVEGLLPYKWLPRDWGRTTGIKLYEEYLWIDIWRDDSGWTEQKKWQHISINWKRILFGRDRLTKTDLATEYLEVVLPEGRYKAKVNITQFKWTFKRFKKPLVIIRSDVQPEIPIPIPGKGENSWDIDDDAIYSFSTAISNPHYAAEALAKDVMETRRKRAGYDWMPTEGFKVKEAHS
jgi:hypothetical protein